MTKFLNAASAARLHGKDGKQAIKAKKHRDQVKIGKNAKFTGSVDIDEHFKAAEPHANRWDYGVGVKAGNEELAFWIEPHPASSSGEVAVVIRKLEWLKGKLRQPEFKALSTLTDATQAKGKLAFHWLYSGKTSFRSGGKEELLLAKVGMELPKEAVKIG